MARTISDIQQQMTDNLVSNEAAIGVTIDPASWSATNQMRMHIYNHAYGSNSLEQIFDTFTTDVNNYIANMKPHKLAWYVNMAKAFQFGFDLIDETDQFDNTGYTDDQIAASKIVAYAAAVKQTDQYNRLSIRIKVARIVDGDLAPLTEEQLNALTGYFDRTGDAGVPLIIDSESPDSLKMNVTFYYDPLILDNSGDRLDGTANDVGRTAIKNYLLNLPFNGTFALQLVGDEIESVDGCVLWNIDLAQYKYGDLAYKNIATYVVPDSGYLRFINDTDLVINYLPLEPIK